jgi:hypothetical protein
VALQRHKRHDSRLGRRRDGRRGWRRCGGRPQLALLRQWQLPQLPRRLLRPLQRLLPLLPFLLQSLSLRRPLHLCSQAWA